VDAKLPKMFFNKDWDLTHKIACPAAVAAGTAKPDELSVAHPRHCSFSIQHSARFGMMLDETLEPLPHGLLVVARVDAGSAFGVTAQGSSGLIAGDVIVEVNGRQGPAAELRQVLRQEFSKSGQKTIDFVVRGRPPSFNIEVTREGASLKLGIAAVGDQSNPGCLLVQGVHGDGLIPSWNAAHGSLCICKGDLITHVNGISKNVASMRAEVQKSSTKGCRLRFRIVTQAGQAMGYQKELHEDAQDEECSETTVPWDMQVRWLDDCMEDDVSTAYGSAPSGTRTPEESCPSGTRTPEEPAYHVEDGLLRLQRWDGEWA